MVSTVNADRIHQLLLEENGWSDRFVLVWRLAGVGLLELGSWNPFAAFGLLGAEVDREAFVYLLLGLVGLAMFYTGQYLDMQAPTWERFVYMRAHPDFRNLLDRMKAVQQDLPLVHQEATVPPSAIEGSQDVDLFATAVPMVGMLCGFAWPGVVTQAATLPIMYERLGQVKDRMSKWLQDERVGPPEFVNSNATNLLTWCMHVHAYTSFVELTSYVVAVAGCLCITVSWFLAFFCYMGFGQHFQYTLLPPTMALQHLFGDIVWIVLIGMVLASVLACKETPEAPTVVNDDDATLVLYSELVCSTFKNHFVSTVLPCNADDRGTVTLTAPVGLSSTPARWRLSCQDVLIHEWWRHPLCHLTGGWVCEGALDGANWFTLTTATSPGYYLAAGTDGTPVLLREPARAALPGRHSTAAAAADAAGTGAAPSAAAAHASVPPVPDSALWRKKIEFLILGVDDPVYTLTNRAGQNLTVGHSTTWRLAQKPRM